MYMCVQKVFICSYLFNDTFLLTITSASDTWFQEGSSVVLRGVDLNATQSHLDGLVGLYNIAICAPLKVRPHPPIRKVSEIEFTKLLYYW